MTTLDARMFVDAMEEALAHRDKDLTFDSFLDQTIHASEHGVGLTELGRLILDERVRMKAGEEPPGVRRANERQPYT